MTFRILPLFLFLSTLTFAQNATLTNCTITLSGDDGKGSIAIMSSPQSAFGCCIIMQPNPGTPPTSYLSADCDTNVLTLANPITINLLSLSARKNDVQFSPFETLIISTPDGRVRKFDMFWMGIGVNQGNERTRDWPLNMFLPAGTTFQIDAYFSANSASVCAGNACIASTIWRLQSNL